MMFESINPTLQWLNTHPQIAGVVTFFISAIESIAIIGTIIPGSVMMTAIGTLAGAGVIPFWFTILWAILGAIVGDGISYWLGHHFKDRIHDLWPFRQYPYILASGEDFFQRHGAKSVFIGRFVGPVRALVPLVAGMLGMQPWRFTLANVISAIGWAPAYMLPGLVLGAASLELPPDMAVHVILVFLLVILFGMLCLWIIRTLFNLIQHQVHHLLTNLWKYLSQSKRFNFITYTLKHHHARKTYGQLALAFYCLIISMAFIYLASYVFFKTSPFIEINSMVFHLFRSLRTPLGDDVMIAVAFLGDKYVLLPIIVTLFAWLAYKKYWHTAWHVLALGVVTAGAIVTLKYSIHSLRPWGIVHGPESFSFPSGHTTLVVTFFLGLALLLTELFKLKHSKFLVALAVILILIVSLSRVYLGVHWITDVIGGWLLGAVILMLITISYNRKEEKHISTNNAYAILMVILAAFAITYSIAIFSRFEKLKQDVTPVSWPTYTISLHHWWEQQGDHLPLFRINRFGFSGPLFNVQWVGSLEHIKYTLLSNGWKEPAKNDWVTVLHRISDIESTQHLPLVSPLHLDKDPVLVLVKQVEKKIILIRFWRPDIILTHSMYPLWVGSVEQIPRTYSWLFSRRQNDFSLASSLLFTSPPKRYDVKRIEVHLQKNSSQRVCTIILIKPDLTYLSF